MMAGKWRELKRRHNICTFPSRGKTGYRSSRSTPGTAGCTRAATWRWQDAPAPLAQRRFLYVGRLGEDNVAVTFIDKEFQVRAGGAALGENRYTTMKLELDVTDQVVSGGNEIAFFVRHRAPNVLTNITVTRIELRLEYAG